jgi:hypothetical protein
MTSHDLAIGGSLKIEKLWVESKKPNRLWNKVAGVEEIPALSSARDSDRRLTRSMKLGRIWLSSVQHLNN